MARCSGMHARAWALPYLSVVPVEELRGILLLINRHVLCVYLLNRASSMMWAAIQKKKKRLQPCVISIKCTCFSTLYDGRNEKGQTCEGLSSERPKNKQDKVLKDKKVIDKMKKGQNKKSKTVRGQKAYRTMW